jgi:Haem-binding domain/Cytochrome P460
MKTLVRTLIAGLVAFAILQLIRPGIPASAPTAELQAPPEVMRILQKDCYSCHSNQRRLAWFDQIVPAYWLVRSDILTAREHLNFSTLGSKPAAAQKATLFEAVNMIQLGAMPLPQFVKVHPEANVTPDELATLKAYLAPWTNTPPAVTPPINTATSATPVPLASVQAEFNGFPFDPGFENWKLISTTDRGDNNTFRFILGNDVAISAAQSGHISPWPDGTRFAKIAWQQELGPDGLLHPGKFVQVELMLKDQHAYKATEGWNWGRWRGLDLKPYGNNAGFVKECTGCHQPVRGNDYVYTLPITAAQVNTTEAANNAAAQLPKNLPYQPLGWSAITMYVDPATRATATLYGNDAAMPAVRAQNNSAPATITAPAYPPGAVLALITWSQRDDPHWFGARIPATPSSVEFVNVANQSGHSSYQRFSATGELEQQSTADAAAQRTQFILSLPPARLP